MLLPPAPFDDFELSYPASSSHSFPQPPLVPPSSELFSSAETDHIFDFLDVFGGWELEHLESIPTDLVQSHTHHSSTRHAPYHNPHLQQVSFSAEHQHQHQHQTRHTQHHGMEPSHQRESDHHRPVSSVSDPVITVHRTCPPSIPTSVSSARKRSSASETSQSARPKQLLSSPQKRLNHIMSEQKRRNTIRDGYAQLIALLAPDGTPVIDMPARGRPKGSGGHGKGGSKGKSGVLFRAVEYIKFLEENINALHAEVLIVEQAAGIQASA